MSVTIAVMTACALSFAVKLTGFSVPQRLLVGPVTTRTLTLLPVALLAGLVSVQTFSGPHQQVLLDARVAGLTAAVVALVLRAPFLVVICVAAAVAGGLRALGWAS